MRTFLLIGDRLFRLRICRRIGSPTLVLRQLHVFSLSGLSLFFGITFSHSGNELVPFQHFCLSLYLPPASLGFSTAFFYRNKSLSFPVFPLRQLCYSVSCGLRLESCMIAHCSLETPWSGKSRSPFSFMLYAPLNCDGGGRERESRAPNTTPPPPSTVACSVLLANVDSRERGQLRNSQSYGERKNRTSCQVRR